MARRGALGKVAAPGAAKGCLRISRDGEALRS